MRLSSGACGKGGRRSVTPSTPNYSLVLFTKQRPMRAKEPGSLLFGDRETMPSTILYKGPDEAQSTKQSKYNVCSCETYPLVGDTRQTGKKKLVAFFLRKGPESQRGLRVFPGGWGTFRLEHRISLQSYVLSFKQIYKSELNNCLITYQ